MCNQARETLEMFIGKNTTENPLSSILKKKGIDVKTLESPTNNPMGVFGRYGTEFGMYAIDGKTRYYFEDWSSCADDVTFTSYIFSDERPSKEEIANAIEQSKDTINFCKI